MLILIESGRSSSARDTHDQSAYSATTAPWTIGLVDAIAGVVSVAVGAARLAIAPGDMGAGHTALAAWIGPGVSGGGFLLARNW